MSQCRDHGEERNLRDRSEEMHGMPRTFRCPAMRGRVSGRRHLRHRQFLPALPDTGIKERPMNFTLTPAATKFIRMMIRADGDASSGFRLAVSPGGCSGLAADISVRREPAAGEAVVERDGVKLFLPAESRILLAGGTIDFADTPSQTGLVFKDPQQVSCSSH